MYRSIPPIAKVLCTAVMLWLVVDAASAAEPPIERFQKSIAPVLVELCTQCHNRADLFAGLDLTSREGLLKGSDAGSVIEPGLPSKSLLLARVADGSMPPEDDGRQLTSDEVEAFRQWISEGAVWDSLAMERRHAKGGEPQMDESVPASATTLQVAEPGCEAGWWRWRRKRVPSLRTRGFRLGSAR